jgi:hypothetical protein
MCGISQRSGPLSLPVEVSTILPYLQAIGDEYDSNTLALEGSPRDPEICPGLTWSVRSLPATHHGGLIQL